MALSREVVHRHIETWTAQLRRFPGTANWPAHLFHATDVKNAAEILGCGRLVCRRELAAIPCDVANQGALWNNPGAHGFVRLYFRPRNSFHLKTEGIKCLGDPYRVDPHMSIPVMLVFSSDAVLTQPGAGFSDGMLSRRREPGFDEAAFLAIDFGSVYHNGPIRPGEDGKRIQDFRMAEVIVPEELSLRCLRRVVCRSPLDRRTLLNLLGVRAADWAQRVTVEQVPQSTFLHKSLYLTRIGLRQGELSLSLHPPKDPPAAGEYQVAVEQFVRGEPVQSWRGGIPAGASAFRIPGLQEVRGGVWRILLEDVLAYEAGIPEEVSVLR